MTPDGLPRPALLFLGVERRQSHEWLPNLVNPL